MAHVFRSDMRGIDRPKVLEQAIDLAFRNGWQPIKGVIVEPGYLNVDVEEYRIYFGFAGLPKQESSIYGTIFRHDFAKALWGEGRGLTREEGKSYSPNGRYILETIGWDDHLKAMVVAEDPIAYLAEHMP